MQPKCITYFRWTECRCRSVQVKKNLFSRSTSATSLILTSAWLPDWEKSRQFGSLSCFVQLSLPEGDAEFWGRLSKMSMQVRRCGLGFLMGEGTTFRMRLATYLRRLPATVVFGRQSRKCVDVQLGLAIGLRLRAVASSDRDLGCGRIG